MYIVNIYICKLVIIENSEIAYVSFFNALYEIK